MTRLSSRRTTPQVGKRGTLPAQGRRVAPDRRAAPMRHITPLDRAVADLAGVLDRINANTLAQAEGDAFEALEAAARRVVLVCAARLR